jgi:hypothetical protein
MVRRLLVHAAGEGGFAVSLNGWRVMHPFEWT